MKKLNFPKYHFRFKKTTDDTPLIFDEVRKKWLQMTPEEWVRQHWIQYLTKDLHVPQTLIGAEIGITVNTRKKRSDIIVYKNEQVILIVECKRSSVKINHKTLNQILLYNKNYQAKYLVLSNGVLHKFFVVDYERHEILEIQNLPEFKNM
jgi:hypothetical protein